MSKNPYRTQLNDAILLLEMKQAMKAHELQKELHIAYESLKPANLIKSTLQEVASSPYLVSNILGAALGLASGYFSRKIAVGKSQNFVRQMLGSVLQFGVTNLVSMHTDDLKYYGQAIFQQLFRNNKSK